MFSSYFSFLSLFSYRVSPQILLVLPLSFLPYLLFSSLCPGDMTPAVPGLRSITGATPVRREHVFSSHATPGLRRMTRVMCPFPNHTPVARGMVNTDWSGLSHVTILGLRNTIISSWITWTKRSGGADAQRKIRALLPKEGEMDNRQVKNRYPAHLETKTPPLLVWKYAMSTD